MHATLSSPCSDSLSLRLRSSKTFTSPRTLSRRFMMQKVRNRAFPCQYYRYRVFFLLLEVLSCSTSLGSPARAYVFGAPYGGITRRGFPHSDISGSKPG